MNKVILIGNLTDDPALTETSAGVKIGRFTIAVKRNYTDSTGTRPTDFLNVTAWRGLGETVARYAHKGNKLAVVGSIEMRSYEDSHGVRRTAVEIVAQDVEFLTPKASTSPTQQGNASPQTPSQTRLEEMDEDTDIPF